jgi:hypothetical protein
MEGEGGCGGDVVVSLGGRWGLEILMNYDQRLARECILVVCSKRELHTLYLCNEHCRQHRTAIQTDVQQRSDFSSIRVNSTPKTRCYKQVSSPQSHISLFKAVPFVPEDCGECQ